MAQSIVNNCIDCTCSSPVAKKLLKIQGFFGDLYLYVYICQLWGKFVMS